VTSLNSPKDFHEVKELVKDIQRRLAILEKVFVFVDLDQINQVIANFGARPSAVGGKAGSDVSFSPSKWDAGPAPADDLRVQGEWQSLEVGTHHHPEHRPAVAAAAAASSSSSSAMIAPQVSLRPSGGASGAKAPAYPSLQQGARSGRLQPLDPPRCLVPHLRPPRAEAMMETSSRIHDVAVADIVDLDDHKSISTTTPDEKSLRSTGSTTAFGSTCGDIDDDVEPERYQNFMKQALQTSKAKQTWMDRISRMREKPAVESYSQSAWPR
jgi:hypothetical protein